MASAWLGRGFFPLRGVLGSLQPVHTQAGTPPRRGHAQQVRRVRHRPPVRRLQGRHKLLQFLQHIHSSLMRLFEFDHLAQARLLAHLQPIQIDPSGDGLARSVPAIPRQPMLARRQRTRPHLAHRLPQDVVDG